MLNPCNIVYLMNGCIASCGLGLEAVEEEVELLNYKFSKLGWCLWSSPWLRPSLPNIINKIISDLEEMALYGL